MGRIVVHEFVSLDGVFEDPRWSADYPFDPRMGQALAALMGPCTAILLGRTTFEMFAPAWSGRTAEQDPGAPFFNDTPKFVVSGDTSVADRWAHSSVVGPYSTSTIADLRERNDGDIYVSGSGTLVRALLADALVDELHLFVYPVVLGAGQRLFPDSGPSVRMRLIGNDSYDSGVMHVTYGPA